MATSFQYYIIYILIEFWINTIMAPEFYLNTTWWMVRKYILNIVYKFLFTWNMQPHFIIFQSIFAEININIKSETMAMTFHPSLLLNFITQM